MCIARPNLVENGVLWGKSFTLSFQTLQHILVFSLRYCSLNQQCYYQWGYYGSSVWFLCREVAAVVPSNLRAALLEKWRLLERKNTSENWLVLFSLSLVIALTIGVWCQWISTINNPHVNGPKVKYQYQINTLLSHNRVSQLPPICSLRALVG